MSAVEPIAIVGIGCRFPGGVRSTEDLWSLLSEGVDGVVDIPDQRWHLPSLYHPDPAKPGRMITRRGGFLDHIDRFDAEFFGISPREAARADPQQRCCWKSPMMPSRMPALPWICWRAGGGVYVGIATWDYSFRRSNRRAQLRRCIHQHRYRSVHSGQPDLLLLQPRRPESRRRHRMLVLARRYPSSLSKHLERRERNGVRGRGERAGAA